GAGRGVHAGAGGYGIDLCGHILGAGTGSVGDGFGAVSAVDSEILAGDARCANGALGGDGIGRAADGEVARTASSGGGHAADAVVAVGVGGEVARCGGDGLVGVGADLELGRGKGAVKQLQAVEFGGLRDAVELGGERADFFVECLAVGGRVGGVGRLDGQFADALEDVAGGLECAFGGLGQRNAVVGVAAGLDDATDLL